MKKLTVILFLMATALPVMAVTPQQEISVLIEKYPTAKRKVWYYFDNNAQREYLRLQLWLERKSVKHDNIEQLKSSFQELWNNTDFTTSRGAQYIGPDTISITIDGNRAAAFDLGLNTISADYAFNTKSVSRGSKPDFNHLIHAFEQVMKGHKVSSCQVKYTGFRNGITFTFQRGNGNGWTSGMRTTIYDASMEDFRKLRSSIRRFIGAKVPVTVYDRTWVVMVKSESTPEFFAVGYNPESKQLNFLKASVEDQICIPLDWQKIDYLTNNEIRYSNK